jgi:conjugal transfer pilus assembly protein TraW
MAKISETTRVTNDTKTLSNPRQLATRQLANSCNEARINSHRSGLVAATLRLITTAIATAWLFVVNPAYANVEQLGPVYQIAEPNLLEDIHTVLREKEASGELKRLEREAIARARKSAVEPRPVTGLKRTTEARRFDWDPSVIYNDEVRDDKGKILVKKGTKVNPLDYVGLRRNFLFLDGRDAAQVAYAKYLISQYKDGVKPVLTAGNIPNVARQLNTRTYFDQGGELIARFGITQVPAMVSQEKGATVLRIDEMLVPDRFTDLDKD